MLFIPSFFLQKFFNKRLIKPKVFSIFIVHIRNTKMWNISLLQSARTLQDSHQLAQIKQLDSVTSFKLWLKCVLLLVNCPSSQFSSQSSAFADTGYHNFCDNILLCVIHVGLAVSSFNLDALDFCIRIFGSAISLITCWIRTVQTVRRFCWCLDNFNYIHASNTLY